MNIPRTMKALLFLTELHSKKPIFNQSFYPHDINETPQFMVSLYRRGLVNDRYGDDGSLKFMLNVNGENWIKNIVICHIAFEGNKYGDWWAVQRSDNIVHAGFHRLKHARSLSFDNKIHRGRFPLDGYTGVHHHGIANILNPDYFYSDTLRWFAVRNGKI